MITRPTPATGRLTGYGSSVMHKIMGLNEHLVPQWRKRGYFEGGKKQGRQYLYSIVDVAKLLIVSELADVGFRMDATTAAAEAGHMALIAQALLRAPLVSLWCSGTDDMPVLVQTIRSDSEDEDGPLNRVLKAPDTDFQNPWNYLVSGGDDFDDWTLIDDLAQVDQLEDYNLAVTHIDLRKLAKRLVNALTEFGTGTEDAPTEGQVPQPVVSFETKDCLNDGYKVVWFSTDMENTPIENLVGKAAS